MSKNFTVCIAASGEADVVGANHQALRHIISNLRTCGGYRSRTDDPLLAKQVL
jgi:hypothetical protein